MQSKRLIKKEDALLHANKYQFEYLSEVKSVRALNMILYIL